MNMICKKWWTSVVINRNFQHEDDYKNISQSVLSELTSNKCADYAVLSDEESSKMKDKEIKVDVEDPDSPEKGDKTSEKENHGGPAKNNAHSQGATGKNCFTQLHVILNRRFKDNIGDYAHSGCLDSKAGKTEQAKSANTADKDSRTALAQSGMSRVILDTETMGYMNEQQNLSPLI